ncbi:uncharacterized protein DNG_04404 [Cephalotrichum gorgonifer]|uniref:BZIP domain-containing protein n=1 Tax=Cephalotrichum gorgonifer TaxID=2041049 RepID=A0AAE8MW29_9PEZI|nr:uncharacterized protein DNG_04404 [Cephalotrichum gorgonifer]
MEDPDGETRPSFFKFWKRSKDDKPVVFVSSDNQTRGAPATAEEKAQHRREQVKKAQAKHRQMKTNYVKKLELDVIRIRSAIEEAERECESFRKENEVMRSMLGWTKPLPSLPPTAPVPLSSVDETRSQEQTWPLEPSVPAPMQGDPTGFSFYQTVTLSMDDTVNQPCYQITSPSSRSEQNPLELSAEGEVLAINFILALEHICWDHFHLSGFPAPNGSGDDSGTESCHTLMASTFCASSMPKAMYENRKGAPAETVAKSLAWQTSGLTLQNLHLLASSINGGDLELTPVQGWFELAQRYEPSVLFKSEVMQALKRELEGVVKCPHMGAMIEREAFESVVERVITPHI